uniref:CUE domain-containing protein n=2 Tax=Hordeum vulgare subsp. vulgare TaxID=112509 RepID=A0A8I6WHP8_HORVV
MPLTSRSLGIHSQPPRKAGAKRSYSLIVWPPRPMRAQLPFYAAMNIRAFPPHLSSPSTCFPSVTPLSLSLTVSPNLHVSPLLLDRKPSPFLLLEVSAMAFKQVFCALREVFPQVDLRILKAVASQYSSDVDAAVGFVLSDVIPAVSEPTETVFTLQDVEYAEHDHADSRKSNLHSGGTTLVDLGTKEDASGLFGTSAVSSGTFCECNPFSDYDGPFHSNNKIEKCSQVEDKVVINETRIPTTVMNSLLQEHYALVGLSSTSATEPHMIEYEQSDSGGCNDHCAAEKDEVTPETEIGNHKHSNDNYELSDLLASSGNMLPLFIESPSDCAVKHGGQVALKLSDEVTRHDFAKSEDNCYLETLLVNFHSKEDKQTSKNLPIALTVHTLSNPKDNNDLQILFENKDNAVEELGALCTAENTPELHKSANDGNLYNLFGDLCTADETTKVPLNSTEEENEQSLYKLYDQHKLFDLFASSKIVDNSLQAFQEKGDSETVHNEELSSIHLNNRGTFTNKSEGFLDNSTQPFHITEINKNISDITKSKELLSCLYESTIMKMKEVELQEEKSRLAKQNADKAHQNFLAMAEHFNQLIENSKESNDKQAQVVCEENCSLVALTQNLQSKLTKLAAQRNEALAAVQEIKFQLDARLATSMEEEATAREQIIQEDKLALLVRKEKEATMGSIMEESRKLQKEAEENILLREQLLDRGHIIDIMQGEISSIHARVSKLKSALVTTSSSANSSHKDDCKSASVDIDRPLGGDENRDDQDHTTSSDDDEWEVLEAN